MDVNPGFVYVLSNPGMPGLVKIGCTNRHPALRAEELSRSTGVPFPFRVEFFVDVTDRFSAEAEVHKRLGRFRAQSDREFFQLSVREAVERVVSSVIPFVPARGPNHPRGQCPICHTRITEAEQVGIWDGHQRGGAIWFSKCPLCSTGLSAMSEGFKAEPEDLLWSLADRHSDHASNFG